MAVEKGSWWLGAIYLGETLIAGWWGGGGGDDVRWWCFWTAAFWSSTSWACACKYTIWDYTFFPVWQSWPSACDSAYWMLAYNNVDNFFVTTNGRFSCRYPLSGMCVVVYCDKYPGLYYYNSPCTYWYYYNTDTCRRENKTSIPPAECRACVLRWWTYGCVTHCDFKVCRQFRSCYWQFVYVCR